MKKFITVLLCFVFIFSLCACNGNVKNVKVLDYESEIYSDEDIMNAVDATKTYFKKYFSGCTLKEISYGGDETSKNYRGFGNTKGAIIIFYSTFDVDSSGGDGSLDPNSTYKKWMWIMEKGDDGMWRHVDHGYG